VRDRRNLRVTFNKDGIIQEQKCGKEQDFKRFDVPGYS